MSDPVFTFSGALALSSGAIFTVTKWLDNDGRWHWQTGMMPPTRDDEISEADVIRMADLLTRIRGA